MYKGLTVKIDGDATNLIACLKKIRKEAKKGNKELEETVRLTSKLRSSQENRNEDTSAR